MAILNHGSTIRTADGGQSTTTIVTATNIGSYAVASSATYYIGTTQNVFNRASGAQTLTGVSIDGNAANITAYTINQNLGTSNAPSFAGATLSSTLVINGGNGLRVFKDGASTIASHIYWANAANTVAYNWQLDENNNAAMWGYTSAWGKLLTVTSAGAFTASGDVRAPIFYDSGNTAYYLDPANTGTSLLVAGNVGIGTTSPSEKLDVTGRLKLNNSGCGWLYGNDTNHSIILRGNRDGTAIDESNYHQFGGTLASGKGHKFWTNGVLASQTLEMQIANDGVYIADNLGIGTTGPSFKLDVNGTVRIANTLRIDGFDTSSAQRAIGFGGNTLGTNGVIYSNGSYISISAATNQPLYLNSDTNGNILISGTSSVGIGTASPSQKLHVVGTGFATSDFRAPIFYDSNDTNYYVDLASTSRLNNLTVIGTMTFGTLAYTTESRRSKNSSNVDIETVTGLVSPSGPTFLEIRGFCPPAMYRTTGDRPAPYGIGFGNGSESGGIMPIGAGDNLQEIMLYGANSGPTTFTFKRQIWEGNAQDPSFSNYYGSSVFSINTGTGVVTASTDIRAPIFYDSNDTTYYLDPASTTLSLKTRGYITINNATAPNNLAMLNIGSSGSGETRAIDISGGWSGNENKSITFTHATASTNIVAQINAQHNGPGSRLRWGKLYHGGDSSTYTMELISESTTSAYLTVAGSVRSPIFYDSGDTNYYLDPAGTSRLNTTRIGNINVGSGTYLNTITPIGDTNINLSAPSGAFFFDTFPRMPGFYDSADTTYYIDPASTSRIVALWVRGSSETVGNIYVGGTAAGDRLNINFDQIWTPNGNLHLQYSGGGNIDMNFGGGHAFSRTSLRAPIFYDFNNTAFYTDPASTSVLNRLTIDGGNYAFDYFQSLSDFTSGTLVTTDIPATAAEGESFVMNVVGKSYSGSTSPFNFSVQGYLYNSTIINFSGLSLDSTALSTVKIFENGGVLCFWWPTITYWNAFEVSVRAYNSAKNNYNRVTNITNSTEPTGTKKVTVTLQRFLRADVAATNSVNLQAPIFYDSNNTSYYLDPNSGSNLYDLTLSGAHHVYLTINPGNDYEAMVRYIGGTGSSWYVGKRTSAQLVGTANFHFYSEAAGATVGGIDTSGNIYSIGSVRSPIFYDSDDTNFYANPAGESKFNYLRLTNNNALYFTTTGVAELNNEGNSTQVAFRMIKSGSSNSDGNNYGVLNLQRTNHTNGATNAGASIFFELKDSGGTIREYAGLSGCKTEAGAAGGRLMFHRYARTEIGYWDADQLFANASMRSPIFYDSDNTGYYLNPAGNSQVVSIYANDWFRAQGNTGLYFQDKGYGITSAGAASNSYGNASTYGTGLNGWQGWGIGSRHCMMSTGGDNFGVHDNTRSWLYYWDGTYHRFQYGYLESASSVRAPLFYDSNNTAYYLDPASTGVSLLVAGKVGIGTTNPTYKLQIGTVGSLEDSIRIGTYAVAKNTRQYIGNTRDDSGLFEQAGNGDSATTVLGGVAGIRIVNTTGTLASAQADNSVQLLTHIYNGGSRVALHANYDGKVGVDTASPSYKLHVVGTAYSDTDFRAPIFYDSNDTGYYIDPNGSSSLFNVIATEFYARNWFRNNDSGEGIYNQTTTQHFYTDDVSYWNVASSSGAQGIRFRTGGHGGTIRGYVYANDSNDVGLLNNGGNWRARVVGGDYFLADGSSIRGQIFYDSNNTAYYIDAASTSVLNVLNVVDANLELYKSQTVDMSNTTTYSTSNYYPVTIEVPTEGCIIQIQNNLNSNVPSWATHGSGFTLNLKWRTNGSGWGTTAVRRIIDQYFEQFTNQTICGGITQMINSSTEVVWLRGGGQYLFKFSRNLSAVARSTTYTVSSQSVSPTSTAQNTVWNAYSGAEIKYNNQTVSTDNMYTPVLYDWNNTSYYVDPASTSNFIGLTVANTITGSITGNAGGSSASCTGNAATATTLQTARNINGTSFNGSAAITTANWGTARTITIGSTGKSVDGSANVSWSLAELGAAATNQTMFIGTTSVAINRSSASQTLTGISIDGNAATVTAGVYTNTGNTLTGTNLFQSNLGTTSGSLSSPPLQAYATGTNAAFMSFHRGGSYAVNMGLDSDNVLRIGGWSASANRWELDMSGNNWVASSFRAPIFYDSNDTNYYVDAASTSNLLLVRTRNTFGERVAVSATASTTINTQYNVTELTLAATITTLTLSNIQGNGIVHMWTIITVGGGVGYSITWPAAVKWPGGTAPTLTTASSKRDIYQFVTYDGGTNIYAIIVGQNL